MSDDLVSVQMSQPMCIMWAKDIKYLCDRIEELEAKLATCEKYRDAYAECDRIGTQVVRDLEARAERLEAAMIQMRDDRTAFRHAVHFRRFITTILKGDDHE